MNICAFVCSRYFQVLKQTYTHSWLKQKEKNLLSFCITQTRLLLWCAEVKSINTFTFLLSLHRAFCSLSNTPTNAHIQSFFFFHWHYSPLWALACRTMSFHFVLICHQLSLSTHSQHLKISFYFPFPSFPGCSPSSRPFHFLSEDFWASYPPPFSLGDLTSVSFALLSILHI